MVFRVVRPHRIPGWTAALALLLAACHDPSIPEVALGRTSQPINDGQLEPGQPSVVVLHHSTENVMCTGTIIGQRVVLTAKHCVRPNQGAGPGEYTPSGWTVNVGPSLNQIQQQYGVEEVRYPPGPQVDDNDIAVMIIAGVMSQTPYPLAGPLNSGFVGDSVHLIGYGVNSCTGGTSGTKYRTTDHVVQFYGANSFITQGQGANQGDSGGPVFNLSYQVVGVMVAMASGNCSEGLTFCTRIDHYSSLIQTALQDTGGCYPTGPEICGDGVDNDCVNGIDDGCAEAGESCTDDTDCVTGWCANLGQGLVCAQSCDSDFPLSGCPAGHFCSELSCGVGVCRVGSIGVGQFGQSCTADADCQSLYCRSAPDGQRYCSVPCAPYQGGCLLWEVCADLGGGCGACHSATTSTQPRGLGELCAGNNECLSNLCMEDLGIRYCSRTCSAHPDCGEGYHCRDGYCVRGELGSHGDPCVAPDDCASPTSCFSDGEHSYCTEMGCGGAVSCPSPLLCTDLGGTGVCTLPLSPLGAACATGADCQSGACVAFDGRSFCTTSCDRDVLCPATTYCTVTDTGALACAPNETPPVIDPPDDPPSGRTGGGCATGGGETGGGWLLWGLLLWALGRRRKRL